MTALAVVGSIRERVIRELEAQGLPLPITDQAALAPIARFIAERRQQRAAEPVEAAA